MEIDNIQKGDIGSNKIIPEKYKRPILMALSYYPELKDVRIHFKVIKKAGVPYSTRPSIISILFPRLKRTYVIEILEDANEPMRSALMKNLPEDEQVAVFAHELFHVIQFHACNTIRLIKMFLLFLFPSTHKKIECAADIGAIEHFQGNGLYKHAIHIRNIPGYVELRPGINKFYLKPNEILSFMKKMEDKISPKNH